DARLFALDAATGRPCADFGSGGEIDLTWGIANISMSPRVLVSPLSPTPAPSNPSPWGSLVAVRSGQGNDTLTRAAADASDLYPNAPIIYGTPIRRADRYRRRPRVHHLGARQLSMRLRHRHRS